jgi:hypothetical protein
VPPKRLITDRFFDKGQRGAVRRRGVLTAARAAEPPCPTSRRAP